jgi:PucR C-terminal helix-turn-helix domain/GGDEF-like domain
VSNAFRDNEEVAHDTPRSLGPALTDVKRDLEQLALSGEGYGALLRRISDETGRIVRLIAVHGGLLATSEDGVALPAASEPASGSPASESLAGGVALVVARSALARDGITDVVCTDGMQAAALALRAGPRRVGLLLVEAPADERVRALMEIATVPLAIEAVRRDAEASARAESAVRLVEELRFGTFRNEDQLIRAARRFGLSLDRPHAAAVFLYSGRNMRTWHTAIRWIEMPVYDDEERGWTVLVGNVASELRRIRARLEGIVGDAPVLGASGPVVTSPTATATSFREAEMVLALLRNRPGEVVLPYEELGLQALLLSVPLERLRTFIDAFLGPVLERTELIQTLRAWYASNGSRAGVAERIGIHRNSVGYRLGRIRELLGVDPASPAAARTLQVALDALDVVEALGTNKAAAPVRASPPSAH